MEFLCIRRRVNVVGVPNEYTNVTVSLEGSTNHTVSKIEAVDLTSDSTGGRVNLTAMGLGKQNMSLGIRSSSAGLGIDFQVAVYGESTTGARDFRVGQLMRDNMLLHT